MMIQEKLAYIAFSSPVSSVSKTNLSLRRRLDVAELTICNTQCTVIPQHYYALVPWLNMHFHSSVVTSNRPNASMPMITRITTPRADPGLVSSVVHRAA
jgi:hypothetical protein